jgi:ectoine hydroxylase-related dioxygenase (phytanoyl-CoA dioxygenase family)
MVNSPYILTEEQIAEYQENGVLIIKGFYSNEEIYPIQKAIYDIIGLIIKKHRLPIKQNPYSSKNFFSGYLDIIAEDRSIGSAIYDAIKKITSFRRLISSEKNQHIYQQLSGAINTGVCPLAQGIRIDNKSEDFYRSLWHQELIYHPQSRDGAVFWSPLVDVTEKMGAIQICLKSHKNGLLKYKESTSKDLKSGNAYSLIFDEEANNISSFDKIEPRAKVRDLVVMNYLTVHQSGFNRSNVSRWTMQMRYFNFQDPLGTELGWRDSIKSGADIQDFMNTYAVAEEKHDGN